MQLAWQYATFLASWQLQQKTKEQYHGKVNREIFAYMNIFEYV